MCEGIPIFSNDNTAIYGKGTNSHSQSAQDLGINEDEWLKFEFHWWKSKDRIVKDYYDDAARECVKHIDEKKAEKHVKKLVKDNFSTPEQVFEWVKNVKGEKNREILKKKLKKYFEEHSNLGSDNTGMWNSGYRNSGYRNSGYQNSGDQNSGYQNSGNRNSGYRNSGNWNSTDFSSGFFNTKRQPLIMFDKPVEMSRNSINFPNYMYFDLTQWISEEDMTNEEKTQNSFYKTTGGYLKTLDYMQAWRLAWDNASIDEKKATLELPNFDADKFLEISGIDVRKERI